MPDYDRLYAFLRAVAPGVSSMTLSFDEVEHIVGGSLPDSARLHRAWWSNDHTHSHALRWLQTGWKAASADMKRANVVFERQEGEVPFRRRGALHPAASSEGYSLSQQKVTIPANRSTRRIGGYEFSLVSDLDIAKDPNGSIVTYRPQSRYARAKQASVHRYGDGQFCKILITNAPEAEGVYAVFVLEQLAYVGEAVNLAKRWYDYGQISPRKCYEDGQETNCRVNKLILKTAKEGLQMTLWFHLTPRRKDVEKELRNRFDPPWNAI